MGIAGLAGGSAGGGAVSPGVAPSAVTGLMIEANPKSVLSAFVSWTTDVPATSVVQFGAGELEWEISDPALVTEHRVLLIGMHASQTYLVRAVSANGGGSVSADGTFATGALPSSIPVAKVTANAAARSQPGWTLMNIQKGDGKVGVGSSIPAQAVMYDSEGLPVWYCIDGTAPDIGGAVSTELTDKGVLVGPVGSGNRGEPPREFDFACNVLWECTSNNCGSAGNPTHHASKLPNGHYVVMSDVTAGNIRAPVFSEITADNEVVWTWDFRDLVPPPQGASGDWCHGNSITVDVTKDVVYANCRWLGLVKTTYQNPTFEWLLPASYDGDGLGNMMFLPTSTQYSDTHDPEIHDDGTIIFYDNGGFSGTIEEGNPRGYHSRVVEYLVDDIERTATLTWEFPGSFEVDPWYANDWYNQYWGDADRLPNGNVLVTTGVRGPSSESRVFEVKKDDGKVVWEFRLPLDVGVYRAERVTPPLVHPLQP
jgi:hypothetical protein